MILRYHMKVFLRHFEFSLIFGLALLLLLLLKNSKDKPLNQKNNCLFKKLLFTMERATAAGSSQSNISRIIFEKTKKAAKNKTWQTSKMTTLT